MHYAVIGAGYGDEGKGLMTDYLCRQSDQPLNVRFNGGAQAGHTVVTETDRHVFSHMGAGTFAGAASYLSSDFIVNPFAFRKEIGRLTKSIRVPLINPNARITTIFDITLNAFRELARGPARHGSCGLGINETVNRQNEGFGLTIADLINDPDHLYNKLEDIYANYFMPRAKMLGQYITVDEFDHYMDLAIPDNEVRMLQLICNLFSTDTPAKEQKTTVIFEGAQGLELDEELGVMPHCTRSVCGLKAAYKAADEIGVDRAEIQPVYVTRSFKTRHGAGPLPHEGMPFSNDKEYPTDKTNVTNNWQQSLRYAPLNVQELKNIIVHDLRRSDETGKITTRHNPVIAVTHMDHVVGTKIGIFDIFGQYALVDSDGLITELSKIAHVKWASYGETAHHVFEV